MTTGCVGMQPEPFCGSGRWNVPGRVTAQSTQVHLVPTCYVTAIKLSAWTP